MNDRYQFDDWITHDTFCDCCGSADTELHKLDFNNKITLCTHCIRRFYALLNGERTGKINQYCTQSTIVSKPIPFETKIIGVQKHPHGGFWDVPVSVLTFRNKKEKQDESCV